MQYCEIFIKALYPNSSYILMRLSAILEKTMRTSTVTFPIFTGGKYYEMHSWNFSFCDIFFLMGYIFLHTT